VLSTPHKRGKAWPSSFLIGQVHLRVHGCRTTAHQPSRPSLLRLQIMYHYRLTTRLNANACTAPPTPTNAILQASCAGMRTEKSPHHNDAKKNDPEGDTVYSSTQLMHTHLQEFMEHTMVARPVVYAGCRRMPERGRVLMPVSHPCIPNHSADATLRTERGPCL